MKRKVILLICVLTMAAALVGCQTSDTYQAVIDKGEMTFALSGAYPPFNFVGDNGDIIGFDVDIASAIADKLGVEAKPITADFDGIVSGLLGNRFDMIIGSMAITEERLEQVNFTDPYYYDGAQFFAMADSNLNSIEDLDEGVVGVVTGTTFHEMLEDMDNIDEVLQFTSDVDNIMAIEQGRGDGLVTSGPVGLNAKEEMGVDLVPVGEPLYSEDIAIAIRKEDTKLLEEVNKALAEIIDEGTYEDLSNKWFGANLLDK